MNNATLEIKGDVGVLTVYLRNDTKIIDIHCQGGNWRDVMARANHEVEQLGAYVQMWFGDTGDGMYRTSLDYRPSLMD